MKIRRKDRFVSYQLSEAEKKLSYAKYMDLPVRMPPPELEEIIRKPMKLEDGIPGDKFMSTICSGGNPNSENRYCMFPDGSAYADMKVVLKNCTGQMLGWWFSWFCHAPEGIDAKFGNLRYKIWDPLDHWDVRDGKMTESFDDGKGDPKWTSRHNSLDFLKCGLTEDAASALRKSGVIFNGSVNTTEGMADRIGVNISEPLEGGGIITRARYWFGWTVTDGRPVRDLKGIQYSEEIVYKILRHNVIEKMRLDDLLPPLFAEQSGKPLDKD
ncbi:MAG: hypothetical protein HUJ76_03320 [Parasporobacterium sp.]|nr:hypothetical protein [Parasporobacterium sp.]